MPRPRPAADVRAPAPLALTDFLGSRVRSSDKRLPHRRLNISGKGLLVPPLVPRTRTWKVTITQVIVLIGRGDKIRTCDPLHPMLVLHSFAFRCIPSTCPDQKAQNAVFYAIIARNSPDRIGTHKNAFIGPPTGPPGEFYENHGHMAGKPPGAPRTS